MAIGTSRLELRPICAADAEVLFPILSDSALYKFTGEKPPDSVASLRAVYAFREQRRSPDGREYWFNWAINVRASRTTVGYVQATVGSDRTDIAWVVGSDWQGQGYATEAARAMVAWLRQSGIQKVHANIHPEHRASHRVAEKCGFVRTSVITDDEEVWVKNES